MTVGLLLANKCDQARYSNVSAVLYLSETTLLKVVIIPSTTSRYYDMTWNVLKEHKVYMNQSYCLNQQVSKSWESTTYEYKGIYSQNERPFRFHRGKYVAVSISCIEIHLDIVYGNFFNQNVNNWHSIKTATNKAFCHKLEMTQQIFYSSVLRKTYKSEEANVFTESSDATWESNDEHY